MKTIQKGVIFSEELVNKLKEAWKLGKKIKITGVNYYGVEFSTEGKITTDDSNEPGFGNYEEITSIINLEFAKSKHYPDDSRTCFVAPFKTKISYAENSLIILSIEIDGEVVFENPNTKLICNKTKKNGKDLLAKLEKNQTDYPDCPVMQEINKLVGKPVIVDGEEGVLVSVDGVSGDGYPIVNIYVSPYYLCSLNIHGDSVLSTEMEDGTRVVLAKNDPEEFEQALIKASSRSHTETI